MTAPVVGVALFVGEIPAGWDGCVTWSAGKDSGTVWSVGRIVCVDIANPNLSRQKGYNKISILIFILQYLQKNVDSFNEIKLGLCLVIDVNIFFY